MDMQHQTMKNSRSRKSKSGMRKTSEKQTMKVVYISTPMKVKTSASKFREIVQELTGQESDVVRIMDKCDGNETTWMTTHDHHHHHHDHKRIIHGYDWINDTRDHKVPVDAIVDDKSPVSSSSEELNIEHFDGVYKEGNWSFGQFDQHTLLYDQYCNQQLDVLGSYWL